MITDEMVDAACVEWWGPESAILDEYPDLRDVMRRCVAAALAAAPAAAGWVWCGRYEEPNTPSHTLDGHRPCPGPHRTLHIGAEVES